MGAVDRIDILSELDELSEYRQLGTVEELRNRIPEEDILKFYYLEDEDKYLIGQRCDTRYYAEITRLGDLCFYMSRYLPWGEKLPGATKPFPHEPKEMYFQEWLKGLMKQQGWEWK